MSVCRAGLPQGGVGCGRGVPWREDGSKRDRGTEGSQRGKRTMAVRIGRTERRKERSCGRSRCVQDNAGRLQRLTGDNVRPLMRPAQRREEAQGGSTQRGAWERIREGRPQSGRSDAHKKSPCSFLQGQTISSAPSPGAGLHFALKELYELISLKTYRLALLYSFTHSDPYQNCTFDSRCSRI